VPTSCRLISHQQVVGCSLLASSHAWGVVRGLKHAAHPLTRAFSCKKKFGGENLAKAVGCFVPNLL